MRSTVHRIFFILSLSCQLFPTTAFEYPRFLPLPQSLPPLSSADSISFLFNYQYGTVLYVSYHIILYNTVLYHTTLYHAVSCQFEYNVKVQHSISCLLYDITIYSIYFTFLGKVQREGQELVASHALSDEWILSHRTGEKSYSTAQHSTLIGLKL